MDERRQHHRHTLPLECTWSQAGDCSATRLGDLSEGGCYVRSRVVPQIGDAAVVAVMLQSVPTTLRGTVVHAQVGRGFALQFRNLDEAARARLRASVYLLASAFE